MSEFKEHREQSFDPWQLGNDLLESAVKVKKFIAHRDPTTLSTINRINNDVVAPLVEEHKDKELFLQSNNAMIPIEDGYGVGLFEGHVKVIGFGFGQYHIGTFGEQQEYGLVALVSGDAMNGVQGIDKSHRLGFLPEQSEVDIEGIVTLIPIVEGVRIAELKKGVEIPDSIADIDSKFVPYEYNYANYVESINAITGQMAVGNERADIAKIESAGQLLKAMNMQCPFLGKRIMILSEYLRFPNPAKGNHFFAGGGNEGILRKFVIDIYQDPVSKEFKSDVQAVVYEPEIAKQVYSGKLPAAQADKLATTCFVPLSFPHLLAVMQQE